MFESGFSESEKATAVPKRGTVEGSKDAEDWEVKPVKDKSESEGDAEPSEIFLPDEDDSDAEDELSSEEVSQLFFACQIS